MTDYTITITAEDYVQPTAAMTEAEYLAFVLNRAAESYRNQYGCASKEEGIAAACAAFNASLTPPETPADPDPVDPTA